MYLMHKFNFYGTWDECEKYWNDKNLNDKDVIIKSKKQREKEKEEYDKCIKNKKEEYDKKNNKKYDKKYDKDIIKKI